MIVAPAELLVADAADAPALAALHAAALPANQAWGTDAIALLLALPGAFGFWRPHQGFGLARVAADEAEILTLAVAPAARRQGLARALLAAMAARAAGAGAAALFLEVGVGNAAARALYVGAGFACVGRRARYYADGTDALLLRRALG